MASQEALCCMGLADCSCFENCNGDNLQTGYNIRFLERLFFSGLALDRAASEYGQVAGTCECGNEPLGSIKCREFLDSLGTS